MLKRRLGFWDSVAINIGIVIGVGIFRTPGEVAKYLDASHIILLAWVAGGVITLLGGLCYAELSSSFPQTGGTYVYLRESYGRLAGFLYGWVEILILRAGSLAGVAYVFADYLVSLFPPLAGASKWIAVAGVVFFTGLNVIGLHYGTRTQAVLSMMKVVILLAMSVLIFRFGSGGSLWTQTGTAGTSSWGTWAGFAPALIPVLWSYGGFHESTFMSGEFKDTRRELPLSLIVSTLAVMALYLLVNVAYLKMVTPSEMAGTTAIASDIFKSLFGPRGQWLIACAILISASGALNSTILTGARIPFALGTDHARVGWLGTIHAGFETPARAFLFNGVWASVLVLWGNFESLLFFTGFVKWLEFILVGASVFILRKRIAAEDRFLMVGYPLVPLAFTAASVWLCLAVAIHTPMHAFTGLAVIVAGVPVYYFLCHKQQS
ncbi:MAG: amino acid permease [Candidatus Omnitrophota bacterium]|nr:amino acid permease [Candidatus Omnitrophota bacterium]